MASTSADSEAAIEVTMPVTSNGTTILTSSVLDKAHSCPEDAADAVENMGAAFDTIFQAFPHAEIAAATTKLQMAYGSLSDGNLHLQNTARDRFAALLQLFFNVGARPDIIKGPNHAHSIGTRPEYFQSRMEMMTAQFQDLYSIFFVLSHVLCERCSPVKTGPSSQDQSKASPSCEHRNLADEEPTQEDNAKHKSRDLSRGDDQGVEESRSEPVPATADRPL